MKKIIMISTVLILAMSMVLAGCSSSKMADESTTAPTVKTDAAAPTAAPKGDGKPTKVTLWTFQALHETFYKSILKNYNAAYPDQQIDLVTTVLPYDDLHSKLLIALQSGVGAPDLADIEQTKYPNFLKGTPQLADLNDIVDPVKSNLVMSRLDMYAKDGKYYGIDFHVGAAVIFYNKEILAQANVNPDDIKTWADYEEAGKKVLAATGKPMGTVETSDKWSFWPLITQQKSDLIDKDGKIIIDNDINIKTLQFLQKLEVEKVLLAAPGGGHHTEEYFGFMNKGGAASIWMPFWYAGRFTDSMPDLKGKMIVRPMPAWEAGGSRSAGMGGTGTSVIASSKVAALAKNFLAFAKLSKDGNIEIWKQLGFDPIRSDVWDDPALKEPNKFTDYFGTDLFSTVVKIKDEIEPVNVTDKTPAVGDAVNTKVLPQVLGKDQKDPATVLKAVADGLRK